MTWDWAYLYYAVGGLVLGVVGKRFPGISALLSSLWGKVPPPRTPAQKLAVQEAVKQREVSPEVLQHAWLVQLTLDDEDRASKEARVKRVAGKVATQRDVPGEPD